MKDEFYFKDIRIETPNIVASDNVAGKGEIFTIRPAQESTMTRANIRSEPSNGLNIQGQVAKYLFESSSTIQSTIYKHGSFLKTQCRLFRKLSELDISMILLASEKTHFLDSFVKDRAFVVSL